MPLVIKSAGSIAYTEINTAVVNAGGFATASFNGLNAQAYTITNSSVYLPPDKFSEFVGTSGNVFTFGDWNGTVSVSSLGAVTFTVGNAASVSITSTLSYSLVGIDTSRTISVSIVVPSGFSNAGATISGTKTATQPARNFTFADWTGGISINQEGVVSSTLGNAAAVTFTPASFTIVSVDTNRVVSVTVTPPSDYFNAGTPLAAVNVTVTQPAKLFTFADWNGTLSVNCEGVISATTGNAATPITFNPTSYPAIDIAETRNPTITITVPSGYGNSGTTISGSTKSATQPAKFLSSTWTGVVSINKNTGAVSATTGNAASIQSITPSTVALVTTSTNRDITVVIVIPSGYCNSGTLSITKTVSQAAADETINITIAGSHNTWQPSGQGDAASLSISTVSVWNTSWTVEVSDAVWIYLEDGIYTGTGNATKMIAVQPNYVGSAGYTGSTRTGYVKVYKTSNSSIYDTVFIQQAVGTAPVTGPTFTMSGKTHTFAWNAGLGSYHTITISNFGGNLMTYGTFSMFNNDFVLYDIDAHVTVNEDNPGDWVGTITNFAQATYSIGVYPKSSNTSTTNQRTATIDFVASNSGGSSQDSAIVTQAVSPPTFTINDAGVNGFAVAQSGAVTAPQATAGTITNRSYSAGFSGGSYSRVNVDTQRSVVVTVQVPAGYSNSGGTVSGTFYATQSASPTFNFGDSGATGFAVDASGNITAPYVTSGTLSSVTYNGSVGNAYYDIVNTNTNRTATVYVTAPGGYYNSGALISGDVSTTQPATDTFTFATANVTGFAVSQGGTITEPNSSQGTIVSRTYIDSIDNSYYPIVNTDTYRNADIVINVPGGYFNSGGQVSDTVTANQIATPTFTFGMWDGGVSIGQNGVISYSQGNANSVTINTGNFPVVYTDTSRDVSVTIYAPFGYYNFGGAGINGTKTVTQPAAPPPPPDPTVTVYTLCNTYQQYYIEGNYSYPYIEILGYCAYYSETTTRSVAQGLGYTEFFFIAPSSCDCG
jgi:hypothetical protein